MPTAGAPLVAATNPPVRMPRNVLAGSYPAQQFVQEPGEILPYLFDFSQMFPTRATNIRVPTNGILLRANGAPPGWVPTFVDYELNTNNRTVEVLLNFPDYTTNPTTQVSVSFNVRVAYDITFTDAGGTRTRQGVIEGECLIFAVSY